MTLGLKYVTLGLCICHLGFVFDIRALYVTGAWYVT